MFTGWWEIFEKNRECMTRKECRKIIKRGCGVGGVGWGGVWILEEAMPG